jgi:hypothetical protein
MPDSVAYLDESGAKGYIRDLGAATDKAIGVLGALVVPTADLDALSAKLKPAFEHFRTACHGKIPKLHVTDALASKELHDIAVAARDQIFSAILEGPTTVVYDALRLGRFRIRFAGQASSRTAARMEGRNTSIQYSKNPSTDRIEHELMQGVAIKLDALAEDKGWSRMDLLTDRVDAAIEHCFGQSLTVVRSVAKNERKTHAFDRSTGLTVSRTIQFGIRGESSQYNVTRIATLTVLNETTPLSFAADVVTNSLCHHLRELPDDAPLNAPSSIQNWQLGRLAYGIRDDAIEDLI